MIFFIMIMLRESILCIEYFIFTLEHLMNWCRTELMNERNLIYNAIFFVI
jgi:hypothetical protein